jgi:putative addiction module component (TIGR02574 family)
MRWVCAGPVASHPNAPATVKRSQSLVLPAWPVVHDLLTLPLAQRLELVQTLWDSIAAEQRGPELTDSDRQLIDRRLDCFLADGDPGVDADAVLDGLEQSL